MRIFQIIILIFISGELLGQTIDYNKIILPKDVKQVSIEEKLVQLSWDNNPENKLYEYNILLGKKNVQLAAWSWLDNFAASFNANEFTIDPSSDVFNRSAFYPAYNFSVRVTLGDFVLIPLEVRRRKIEVINEENKLNMKKIQTRANVLNSYYNFLEKKELLKIQAEALEEIYSKFISTENEFKNGFATYDDYALILSQYQSQKQTNIRAKYAYEMAKVQIEQLIGIDINSVIVE